MANNDGLGRDKRRFDRRGRGYGWVQACQARVWELAGEIYRAMPCKLREDADVRGEVEACVWALTWALAMVEVGKGQEDVPWDGIPSLREDLSRRIGVV